MCFPDEAYFSLEYLLDLLKVMLFQEKTFGLGCNSNEIFFLSPHLTLLSSHLISPFSHLTSSHPSLIFDFEKFHLSCTLTQMCFPQLGCNSNEIFLLSSLISPHRRSSEEEELLTNHLSSQSVMEEKESQWDDLLNRN
jgi:hypothetical protein